MKRFYSLLLVLLFALALPENTMAQEEEEKYKHIPKRSREQMDAYLDGDYLFPPKPRNNWSLGLKGGLVWLAGDVKARPGWTVGVDVQRALGHVVSIRLEGTYGNIYGQNYQEAYGYRNHAGNPWSELYYKGMVAPDGSPNPPPVFYNYKANYFDVSGHVLFNLNNINFYREQVRWNIYGGLGLGLSAYHTRVNALDENDQPYDFGPITQIPLNDNNGLTIGGRDERLRQLNALMDNTYETPAEGHSDEEEVPLFGSTYVINPAFMFFGGVRYRVNTVIELSAEVRGLSNLDDLIDGQRWTEHGVGGNYNASRTAKSRSFDMLANVTFGIGFRLGKKEEALWWSNPLTTVYSSAQDARQIVDKLNNDTDQDGVPDLYDKEPDTPEGYLVDVKGRALDSDGDGYPDSEDDEPFSPKGCPVDNRGVSLDLDDDGVPDCFDKEPNSPPGMYYDAKGVAIQMPNGTGPTPCLLPVVHFDFDSDVVMPEFYPELYYIASMLLKDPNLTIKAIGHTDARGPNDYNYELSKRRVNNVVNFIANTYEIPLDRFEMDYMGKDDHLIKDLPANRANPQLEPLHYANRRVEFECIENEPGSQR